MFLFNHQKKETLCRPLFFFFKLCWCLIVLVKVSVWWRVAELSVEPLVATWPLSDGCCGSALFSSILLHILRCIVMYLVFVHFHLLNSNSCSLAYQISSHIPQQHPGLRCVIASSVFLLWGEKSDLVASLFSIAASATARLIDSCCSASAAHGSVRAAMKETESVFLQQSKANFLVNSIWHVLTSCQSVLHYS